MTPDVEINMPEKTNHGAMPDVSQMTKGTSFLG